MNRTLAAVFLAAALMLSGAVNAGRAIAAEDYDLGEIVVTAKRPIVEQVGTVREIDSSSIDRATARTLDEAIKQLPGVNVRTGGNGTPRIDVRGLRTRHVKLLINGVPFNSPADGQFDPTLIPTSWISKIKFTPGASSQLYGDGALGGVINIITKRGAGAPSAEAQIEAGDMGSYRFNGSFAAGTDKADIFVNIGRRERDGQRLADDFKAAASEDGNQRLNSDSLRDNAYLAVTYRPNEFWEFGLTLQYFQGEHGIPPGIFDNQNDIFAQRPRFDRVNDEAGYYVQVNALYAPNEHWNTNAWAYINSQDTHTDRYADDRFLPVTDPSVRNTFSDEARPRTIGLHSQTEFTHRWGGTFTFMVDARQERLLGDCVVQDVVLATPAAAAASTMAASTAPPSVLVLDYDYTTTNNAGITSAAGTNQPIARLTASNRPGGGVDFSLQNLATNNFGGGSFLQSVLISPTAGFNPAGLSFTQGASSQGEIGNVRFFNTLENADGYLYPIQVNFRRPGVGDPLLQGETAEWLFSTGTVTDYFGQPTTESGALGPDMFSGIRIRGTDASGFWGLSAVDNTGGGALNRVYVQARSAVDPNASPAAPTPAVSPPLIADPNVTGGLLQNRICGGGAGDGSGGGDGTGTNRVETLPGFVFGRRLITQDHDLDVFSSALEFSLTPLPRLGLVFGVGNYWLLQDDGTSGSESSFNLGASYQLPTTTQLRAAYARKVRAPSIAQLHDPVSGNTDLDFEIAKIFETGFKQPLGAKTNLDVTFFLQDVLGLIQRDAVTTRFENIAKTCFKGVEVSVATEIVPRLRLTTYYTHLASRDESRGTQRKEQQYTPGNTVSVVGDYAISERLGLHLAASRVADQVFYSRVTPLVRRALNDYTLVDVNLHYDLPGDRISLHVGCDNLFDENYEESYGLPQAGRFIFGGVRIKFL